MIISLIVAISKNGVIGSGQSGIPWHLPRDSAHFRAYTQNKWMLLGRKTYAEMDGWFTTQTPVVMTRNADFTVPNGHRAVSIEDAIMQARSSQTSELVVSGGAGIYKAALPFVEKLVITQIDAVIEGSIYFPDYDVTEWDLVKDEHWPKDQDNTHNMTLQTLTRR